ncbi:MAG: GyrI-like domain-containing protein [Fimbriimonadaceae bacterium]
MKVEKISLSARRYVAVRHTGPYSTIALGFEKLFGLSVPLGIPMQGAPAGFWYDDPMSVPEEELKSAAAFPVADDFTIEHAELHVFDVPAGDYLSTVFFGPYSGLDKAWPEFTDAVRDQNPDWHVCFEEYLNDCHEVAPEDIQTRLIVKSS